MVNLEQATKRPSDHCKLVSLLIFFFFDFFSFSVSFLLFLPGVKKLSLLVLVNDIIVVSLVISFLVLERVMKVS